MACKKDENSFCLSFNSNSFFLDITNSLIVTRNIFIDYLMPDACNACIPEVNLNAFRCLCNL